MSVAQSAHCVWSSDLGRGDPADDRELANGHREQADLRRTHRQLWGARAAAQDKR